MLNPQPHWRYEYCMVDTLEETNNLGAQGWRVVPGSITASGRVLMERMLEDDVPREV